MQTLFDKLIGI